MTSLAILCQLVIAAGIINVWIVRYRHPTPWRPAGAANMEEEFRRYGLPDWMRVTTGAAKLGLAALLLVGIWVPAVAVSAAAAMAALMAGAVLAHARIGDPLAKSLPAFSLLLLSVFVIYANTTT